MNNDKNDSAANLQEMMDRIQARRNKPIAKASRKLSDFINECVSDPDFKHPESRELLHFLLVVRDVLIDGIDESWTIDNIIAPIEKGVKASAAREAAIAKHSKPGGSRELKEKIREVWASGKFASRDICAEEEWAALGFKSFATARKALRGTPDPT